MNFLLFCLVILIVVLGLWLWEALLHVKLLKKEKEAWLDTAAQFSRNEDYYRGLVQRCGKVFGAAAYQCDDGVSVSQDILCDKVPELVEQMAVKHSSAVQHIGKALAISSIYFNDPKMVQITKHLNEPTH